MVGEDRSGKSPRRNITDTPRHPLKRRGCSPAVAGHKRPFFAVVEERDAVAGDARHYEFVVAVDAFLFRPVVRDGKDGSVAAPFGDTVTEGIDLVSNEGLPVRVVLAHYPVFECEVALDNEQRSVRSERGGMHHAGAGTETDFAVVVPRAVAVLDAEDLPLGTVADKAQLVPRVDEGRFHPIGAAPVDGVREHAYPASGRIDGAAYPTANRKTTRLNSSHSPI